MSLKGLYIPLLEGLGVSERESVFQLATRILYEDAQVIIREGDPGRGLFLLASGNVSIAKQTIDGTPEILAVMEPGECFGELALVDHKPRSATATAVGEADVYAFEQATLYTFFADHSDVHLKILQNLVRITSGHLRFSNEILVQSPFDTIIEIDSAFRILKHGRITERPGLIAPDMCEDAVIGRALFDVVSRLGEGVRQQLMRICELGERSTMGLEYELDNGRSDVTR